MSLSRDLLTQARHLAAKESRRPKQASLRRAVSTAYYALFHFLGEESSRSVVGGGSAAGLSRNLARRSIGHTQLKGLCSQFLNSNPKALFKPFWAALPIAGNSELTTISSAFRDLQSKRHAADYDLSRGFTRGDALDACDMADDAISAWHRLKSNQPDVADFFSLCILLWPGLSGRE